MIDTSKLKFYLIQKPDNGNFLQWTGYYGCNWTEKIEEAKVYLQISVCRSAVTSIFKQFPEFGICNIIEITGGQYQILNEKDRVQKSIEKKKLELINREKENLKYKQERIEEELAKLQEELIQVKSKTF